MKKTLLSCVLLTAFAAFAAAEPAEEARPAPAPNPAPSAIGVLTQLLSYGAVVDRTFSADLENVMVCARGLGASIGLRVAAPERGGIAVVCERTVAHDTQRDEVVITPAVLDGFNRAFGHGLRVDSGVFGFGTGRPAAGGMPSFFFTPITPEHARPAVHGVISDRDTPREC